MKTTFIIKNGNTGLTSDDVFNCTDLLQLQQWEMEQQIDVTSMRVQLEKANQYKADQGQYENKEHYNRLKKALILQENLYSIIKKQIAMLQLQKNTLNNAILKVVKSNMTDQRWNEIIEEAKLILSTEEDEHGLYA